MNEILKAAVVQQQAVGPEELALINKQSLRELAADEVFTFRLAACDDQVDRIMSGLPWRPWRAWLPCLWGGRC